MGLLSDTVLFGSWPGFGTGTSKGDREVSGTFDSTKGEVRNVHDCMMVQWQVHEKLVM